MFLLLHRSFPPDILPFDDHGRLPPFSKDAGLSAQVPQVNTSLEVGAQMDAVQRPGRDSEWHRSRLRRFPAFFPRCYSVIFLRRQVFVTKP